MTYIKVGSTDGLHILQTDTVGSTLVIINMKPMTTLAHVLNIQVKGSWIYNVIFVVSLMLFSNIDLIGRSSTSCYHQPFSLKLK